MNRPHPDAPDELAALKRAARAERERLEDPALDDDPVYGELTGPEREALEASVLDRVGATAPVVPLRPRRPWLRLAAAGVAAAAVVLLVMWPQDEALPAYALVPPEGDALVRDEASARAPSFAIGREIELLFRPASATTSVPELACFVRTGKEVARFFPEVERSEAGAVIARVRSGPGGKLPVAAGQHEIVCLLFPRGAHDAGELGAESHAPDIQRFTLPLALTP